MTTSFAMHEKVKAILSCALFPCQMQLKWSLPCNTTRLIWYHSRILLLINAIFIESQLCIFLFFILHSSLSLAICLTLTISFNWLRDLRTLEFYYFSFLNHRLLWISIEVKSTILVSSSMSNKINIAEQNRDRERGNNLRFTAAQRKWISTKKFLKMDKPIPQYS